MNIVPVIFFAYNRPAETRRVLQQLKRQTRPIDTLIAFVDGPKPGENADQNDEVKKMLTAVQGFTVRLVFREKNLGCARNITSGISEVLAEFPHAVILEDDVFPAESFYESMCILLEKYAPVKSVFSVGGYPGLKPDDLKNECADVIFSPRFSCWGWATWSDRWQSIAPDLLDLTAKSFSDLRTSTLAGPDIPSFVQALDANPGKYWDIPLLLQCVRLGHHHAHTRFYLTNNIGMQSGIHGKSLYGQHVQDFFRLNNPLEELIPKILPDGLQDQPKVSSAIFAYIKDCKAAVSRDQQVFENQNSQVPLCSLMPAASKFFQRLILRYPMSIFKWLLTWCRSKLHIQQQAPLTPPKPNAKDYSTIVGKGSVVPCQIEAYFLALNRYVDEGANVLDVGFGLGYGLNILAIKATQVCGVDVDPKVLEYCTQTVKGRNPRLKDLQLYDGYHLQYPDEEFDVVTCVDVLEHVEEYDRLLIELLRITKKGIFISTPNRRPEYTNPDGTPKNHWHLREWSFEELDAILRKHGTVEWNFLNGPFNGPFTTSDQIQNETMTLSPFLRKTT